MTTRERFIRCMRFEPVDRPPNFELGYWGQTLERWIAEGMPPEQAGAGGFYGHEFFGIERREYVPVNFGPIPPFGPEVIEETDRYMLLRDEYGQVRKALKEGTARGTRASMDQYISFAVEKPEDFERVKERFDPTAPGRVPEDLDAFAEKHKERDYPLCAVPNAAFGLFSHARRLMGTERLCYAWYDWPELMHEMMDFFTEFAIETLRPVLKRVECDYFNIFEDFAFKTGPLVSPPIFERFLLPRYKRLTQFLHDHGIDIIWFDSDGNFDVLVPMLIEAGITCIWPLEVAAGNDPRELRRRFGRQLAVSGGIDKRVLASDKQAIRAELEAKIPALVREGGYIPTLDHSVPPDVPYSNFLYYLDLKVELMSSA